MNIRIVSNAFVVLLLLPLAACQKPQAATSYRIKGADNVEHAVSVRINKPWTLTSKVCEKSGKNLMKPGTVEGSALTIEIGESLLLDNTTLIATDTFKSSDSKKAASAKTTFSYRLRMDENAIVWLETVVTKLEFNDLSDKFGIQPEAKVGDKVEQKYEATSSTLVLTQANSKACDDNKDAVISTYK